MATVATYLAIPTVVKLLLPWPMAEGTGYSVDTVGEASEISTPDLSVRPYQSAYSLSLASPWASLYEPFFMDI